MKYRYLGVCVFIFCSSFLNAQIKKQPKLIVSIIVDQMKQEYLHRFFNDFSDDGFKRLLKDGYEFKNMHYNYMPTYTGPGHASVYTGTTPSVHGIVANHWFKKSVNKEVYCVEDSTVFTLGEDSKKGQMSPINLKTTTFSDELKLATNQQSKVFGVSIKDRGAILPVGHFADGAFWMGETGNFISSSYYFKSLPLWVKAFNESDILEKYLNQEWDLLNPLQDYNESIADDNDYEILFKGYNKSVLPYDLNVLEANYGPTIIQKTPFGNDIILDFALQLTREEGLGKDSITDFLSISFSSTDKIGHIFGPRSVEIQDTYLRLDQNIASLLHYFDDEVGKGNYLLMLTADHAGAENPKHLNDYGYNVESLDENHFENEIREFLETTFGHDLLKNYSNQNIYFDIDEVNKRNLRLADVIEFTQNFCYTKSFINRAYSSKDILSSSFSDPHLHMISNGYDVKQNGEIILLFYPAFMEHEEYGTTHGTTYSYDTHVPNLWYGWNIKPGHTSVKKHITQLIPTMSQMFNITFPNGSNGDILIELLSN